MKPGGFTVRGVGCYDGIKIVADSPALDGVTDATLSNWGCSVHEAFDTWPSDFGVLAVDTDAGSNYEAADGTTGRPYILARPGGGVLAASETFGPANPSQKRPPDCQSGGYPINCRTGNFWHTFSDLAIPGRGPGLHLERTYNALGAGSDGPFGYGWSSSYTMRFTTSSTGTVTVHQENGSTVSFRPDGAGGYTAPPRVFATLVANADGTYTFTRTKREVFTFSGAGALVSVRDLNGYTTNLAYDAAGKLATVTDAAGRSLRVAHGPDGRIASASPTPPSASSPTPTTRRAT